jgi:hypothetical protein
MVLETLSNLRPIVANKERADAESRGARAVGDCVGVMGFPGVRMWPVPLEAVILWFSEEDVEGGQ